MTENKDFSAKKRGRPRQTEKEREQHMANIIATCNKMAEFIRKQNLPKVPLIRVSIDSKIHFKTIELSYVPYFSELFSDISYNRDEKCFEVHRADGLQ